jgi:Tubulin-tyrosine ligase family.
LNQETIDNKFIHLTNNAVQKHCDDYGQFEKGNQLSFSDFEKYIRDHKLNVDLRGKVLPRMKELIMHSMNSVLS